MARTIQEIYDQISTEVQSQPQLTELLPNPDDAQTLLSDLSSSSRVANWRLWKWVVAVAIWIHEGIWDLFKTEVDTTVNAARWGTLPWWQQKALEWQYGDSLAYSDYKYQYAAIDADKMIIKRSAAVESGRQVILKVAKETDGEPVKLATEELTAFQSFVAKIRPPGTNISVISYDPDLLKLSYTIYYDPALLNSSGELLSDTSVKPVDVALLAYIKGIVWDGAYNIQKAVDAIQAATGVIDLISNTQSIKAASGVYKGIGRYAKSTAGYMIIDPSFPLSSQITYIANV